MLDHVELISSCLCEMLGFESYLRSHLDNNIRFYLGDPKYCYILNSFI